MTISFACFIAVLLFNVYEFSSIAGQFSKTSGVMDKGFRQLSKDHGTMIKKMDGGFKKVSGVLKGAGESIERNTGILERIEARLS